MTRGRPTRGSWSLQMGDTHMPLVGAYMTRAMEKLLQRVAAGKGVHRIAMDLSWINPTWIRQ